MKDKYKVYGVAIKTDLEVEIIKYMEFRSNKGLNTSAYIKNLIIESLENDLEYQKLLNSSSEKTKRIRKFKSGRIIEDYVPKKYNKNN